MALRLNNKALTEIRQGFITMCVLQIVNTYFAAAPGNLTPL
jgi:hypothetical protein